MQAGSARPLDASGFRGRIVPVLRAGAPVVRAGGTWRGNQWKEERPVSKATEASRAPIVLLSTVLLLARVSAGDPYAGSYSIMVEEDYNISDGVQIEQAGPYQLDVTANGPTDYTVVVDVGLDSATIPAVRDDDRLRNSLRPQPFPTWNLLDFVMVFQP